MITPGVQTFTGGVGQCTTNFVFTDRAGSVYLGQAAHCAGTSDETETNGCRARSLPLGTTVTFNRGATPASPGEVIGRGRLAYSSWVTMRKLGEHNSRVCAYNDFALIKLHRGARSVVNPSVPFWGGPTGIVRTGVRSGGSVFSYGNSSLRLGVTQLSPQTGLAVADSPEAGGWSHTLHAIAPGIPGDSGSAYLDSSGRALGTLSTVALTFPISNGIGDLFRELTYARAHSGIGGLRLELGTTRFAGQ